MIKSATTLIIPIIPTSIALPAAAAAVVIITRATEIQISMIQKSLDFAKSLFTLDSCERPMMARTIAPTPIHPTTEPNAGFTDVNDSLNVVKSSISSAIKTRTRPPRDFPLCVAMMIPSLEFCDS